MFAVVTIQIDYDTETELQDALDELEQMGYSPTVEYEADEDPEDSELDEFNEENDES